MAVVYREDGAEQVWTIVRGPGPVMIPFLALMEVHYKLLRDRPELLDDTLEMIDEWQAETVESTQAWREVAAVVKSRGKISVADAWVAGLALLMDAELVHKDPEFEAVSDLRVVQLPYKDPATRQ
jgi:predicted nucleic acid-binding protein